MAEAVSKCFFLFLSLLTLCSSGTLVGFSDHAKGTAVSSPARTISFLKLNNVTPSHIQVFVADKNGGSVDLCLSKSLFENFLSSQSSVVSWLKSHVMLFLPHVNINSIIVDSGKDGSVQNELLMLLSTLQSFQSAVSNLHLESQVRVSVAFSMSFLEKLNQTRKRDLHRICSFIKKIGSYVMIEAGIDIHLSTGHQFVQTMIEKAILTSYLLPHNEVPVVLAIRSTPVPSATEVAEFSDKVFKSLENNTQLSKQIVGFYMEVLSMDDLLKRGLKRGKEETFPSSHRKLISKPHLTTILHDDINPPTVFPTGPLSTPPVITSPDNPTPTIVTVPATNPVTITPANPGSTPLTVPSATPVTIPSTNPPNSPVPITNPVTTPSTVPGAQPVTNPVTTYPAPSGAVPVVNPEVPPATTNAPAIPGQSWCVAKNGVSEAALQAALDYACGMGGADCSQIQQGASCFDPNTLQNHASYAINSYYQKNPGPTSCDFEGTAAIVNDNPSTGSCIYISSSASSLPLSTSSPTMATPTPTTIPTAPSSTGGGVSSPPTVFGTGDPASGIMPNSSPPVNSSTSFSSGLQPFIGCILLVTSFVTTKIVLDM